MSNQTIDVSRMIDEGRTGGFITRLVIITFLLVVADGFDIAAIGFAAPGITRDFGITDPNVVGRMIAASLVGILFGSPIFGWMGDRFGRKTAIIASCFLFGVFTWLTAAASSPEQIMALRFIAGLGIGGLLPNVTALISELAPARYRAAIIIFTFTGVAFGGALPGVVAATLVAQHGWQVIFQVGGALPILVSLLCVWMLPESVKYLVLKGGGEAQVAQILSQMGTDKPIDANATFVVTEEHKRGGLLKALFEGPLAVLTPLLWLLFIVNLMGYFFLLGWTPVVLQAAKIDPSKAALAGVLLQFGGVFAGLAFFWFRLMERYGVIPVAILLGVAVPVVAGIGQAAVMQAEGLIFALQFLAGVCCLGVQFSINALSGILYPTAVRSTGSGAALGIGRLGSVVGPIVGGVLIARQLPTDQLYAFAALPFAIGCGIAILMARHYKPAPPSGG